MKNAKIIPKFEIILNRFSYLLVCTSLPNNEALTRTQLIPTGIKSNWKLATDEQIKTASNGEHLTNNVQCVNNSKNRHILFVC